MSSRERKQLFIHRGIQGHLLIRFAIHWVLFTTATCALLVTLQTIFNASLPPELRSEQTRLTVVAFTLVSIALLPAFSVDLLKLSHRFVGPVVRLQRFVRSTHSLDAPQLKLRRGDYWMELATDVNSMFDRLRSHAERKEQVLPSDSCQDELALSSDRCGGK